MHYILSKVYASAASIISTVMLLVCFFLGWNMNTTLYAIMVSILICAPALIIVHFSYWMVKRTEVNMSFAWMLMMAAVPLAVTLLCFIVANELPGDVAFLAAIGILSCYAGILSQAISISELFKSANQIKP